MSVINDLIQHKKFDSEYNKGYIALAYLFNVIDGQQQKFFKPYAITPQQYNVLRILRGQHPKPATVGLIKERMIDRNSDASRIVERLRKLELVKRVTCKSDKRAVDVIITSKGLALLLEIDPLVNGMDSPLKALNEQEIVEFNTILEMALSKWVQPSHKLKM